MLGYHTPQTRHPPDQAPPGAGTPLVQSMLGDKVNGWAVRILLECNLVIGKSFGWFTNCHFAHIVVSLQNVTGSELISSNEEIYFGASLRSCCPTLCLKEEFLFLLIAASNNWKSVIDFHRLEDHIYVYEFCQWSNPIRPLPSIKRLIYATLWRVSI